MNTDTQNKTRAHVQLSIVEFRVHIQDADMERRRMMAQGYTPTRVRQVSDTDLELTFAMVLGLSIDGPREIGEYQETLATVRGGLE